MNPLLDTRQVFLAKKGQKAIFSQKEYHRRISAVQASMAREGLGVLVVSNLADITWLSGFQTIGSYGYGLYALVVPAIGNPFLFSSDFESHNAKIDSWVKDIVVYSVLDATVGATVKRLAEVLVERGLAAGRVGCQMGHYALTAEQFRIFETNLPDSEIIDASNVIDRVHRIKSAEEIAVMRRAAALTSAGMKAAINAVHEGGTDNTVAAAAYETIVTGGGEYFSLQPIVTSGARSGIPHSTFRRQKLAKSDCVFIEVIASYQRYSTPAMRVVSVGPPNNEVRRAFEACNASVMTLCAHLRAGVSSRAAARAAGRALRAVEPNLVWHGCYAYSVGLSFPVMCCDCNANVITEHTDFELKAGMVFHCNTSLRKVGVFGVTLGDTVLVTETGHEVLTTVPRKMAVR